MKVLDAMKVEKKSEAYRKTVEALVELEITEGLNVAEDAVGAVLGERILNDWASHNCFRTGSRVIQIMPSEKIKDALELTNGLSMLAKDHAQAWTLDGEVHSVTAYLHGIEWGTLQEIVDYGREHNIGVDMNAHSWYSPLRTVLVEYWKASKSGIGPREDTRRSNVRVTWAGRTSDIRHQTKGIEKWEQKFQQGLVGYSNS